MHILVVEDDHLLNNTLCYNLNAAGYKVDSALDGIRKKWKLFSLNHICLFLGVVILMIVILFGGFLCMTGGDNSSTGFFRQCRSRSIRTTNPAICKPSSTEISQTAKWNH